jgi:dTDP-4-amino-4,6-dideoxygalactose transaminase
MTQYLCFPPPDWNWQDLLSAIFVCAIRKNSIISLETKIKEIYGVSDALVTNLGRTALKVGLKAMGLEKGSRIILPAIICSTVIRSIIEAGYKPILVDVEENLHVSVNRLTSCNLKGARAVIVPHLYGLQAPIEEIEDWTRVVGLHLIDDAAQAVGISTNGRYLGTFGDIGILSFGPFKSLSSTRGGALICNRRDIVMTGRRSIVENEPLAWVWVIRRILGGIVKFHFRPLYLKMSETGQSNKRRGESCSTLPAKIDAGDNVLRISALEAEIVHRILSRIDDVIQTRCKAANEVRNVLNDYNEFEVIGPDSSSYIKIPVRLKGKQTADDAVRIFRLNRIEAERIYRPLHYYQEYKWLTTAHLKTAERNWEKVFLIPNPVLQGLDAIRRLKKAFGALGKHS